MTHAQLSSDLPLVSVIIPAYNAEAYIERTLRSVLQQTYRHLEVLVVDDGSRDRTVEIVQQFAQADSRVSLLRQDNAGVAAARNLAIQAASGEFIAPIDADDIWYPHNLEKQVLCFLTSAATVGVVYSWSIDITEDDRPTGEFHAAQIEGSVYASLLCHNFLGNASSSLIRRACLEQIGGYNPDFRRQNAQGCEDWDLYLRLAARWEFRAVPEFLVGYRKIQQSMSRDYGAMARSHALMLQAVQQKSPQIPTVLFRLSCSSFYLYLARQSSQGGSDRSTLFWLQTAVQVDPLTPVLRVGFYLLAMKSLLRIAAQSMKLPWSVPHPADSTLHRSVAATPAPADLSRHRFALQFKLLVGSLFHRLMQRFYRFPVTTHGSSAIDSSLSQLTAAQTSWLKVLH